MDKNSHIVFFKRCSGQNKIKEHDLEGPHDHLITYLQQDFDYRDNEVVIWGCDRSVYHPRLQYELRLYCDGRLFLKKHEDGFVHNLWIAEPEMAQGRPKSLVMQGDGNLVVYREDDEPMWASHTRSENGHKYSFVIQGDGNLVIYEYNWLNRHPIWSSGTFPGA